MGWGGLRGRLSTCSYLVSLEVGSSAGRKALLAAEAFHLASHTQGIALDPHFLAPGTHYLYIWHIIFYNKSIRKMFISEANIPSNLVTPWTWKSYPGSDFNLRNSPWSDLGEWPALAGRAQCFFFFFLFFCWLLSFQRHHLLKTQSMTTEPWEFPGLLSLVKMLILPGYTRLSTNEACRMAHLFKGAADSLQDLQMGEDSTPT